MNFIRAYQKTCSSQSNVWRIYKRLVVTRYSSKYLAEIYQAGDYLPPFSMAKEAYNHQLFSIEIMQLHTIYEKLIYAITKFPKSGQLHTLIIDFIERFANDFDLVGGTEAEKRGFVEVLNRASLRTFNSACVTRHLFHALVKLGDFEEAELALRTYLYLEGLESESLMDLSRTTAALASNSSIPVPPDYQIESLEIGHQNQLQDPQPWQETAENKIGVLTGAVKMYCQELAKGTEAVRMAELAIAVYNEETCHEFGPQVYRILGISFGFLASQTFDKERRPEYHEKALSALHKSLELDPQYWQTYYQLALQLAETRDILKAVTMISQSLQLNPTHLPSWHLLTLLCTCPVKEGMEQAVKTCELGLSESPTVIKDSWIDFSEEVSQYVLLQMTHTLLVARVYGREQASVAQENLFQTFGKILVPELIADSTSNLLHESISQGSARYGMVLSGSLGNIVEPSSGGSNSVINRGRSSSNASTFTTRSVSSFTGRKLHLAEMFDTASVKSGQGKSGSKPSLLDPKSLLRKDMSYGKVYDIRVFCSLGSFQSAASSTHHTLLENSSGFSRPTTLAKLQHQRSCKMLCDLWLLSAESFLQHGKIDEALKAVGEAENVDWTTHAGVWCLLGRIRLVQKQYQKAIVAFEKGLVTKPSDVECRVWLAKTHLDLGDVEIAEGILENVTQENGWDNSLAWFYLGEIYRMTDRTERTKHCFFYALELESTTPIQSFTILPRFV
ncbi:hypothetical protein EDC94DRAFT_511181 [Helicostylum pulchrum]|nr:hypothetical protein EDC94DRAFT_511181 [Helicostylum pulchrum]